jgi:hypothetical protein
MINEKDDGLSFDPSQEIKERNSRISALKKSLQDLLDNADKCEAAVVMGVIDGAVYTLRFGSIPTCLGLLEVHKKEILSMWEV